MATDLVDFPTTNEELTELACWLEAAFAIDPAPRNGSRMDPLIVATRAIAAREHRNFCIVTPSLFA